MSAGPEPHTWKLCQGALFHLRREGLVKARSLGRPEGRMSPQHDRNTATCKLMTGMLAYTRPTRNQASQHSHMRWGWLKALKPTLKVVDTCWLLDEEDGVFLQDVVPSKSTTLQ